MAKKSDRLVSFERRIAAVIEFVNLLSSGLVFKETQVIAVARKQAKCLQEASDVKASASRIVAELILARDEREAALRETIRANGDKMTEKSVDLALLNDAVYVRMRGLTIEAKHAEERAEGLQSGYRDRSYMIRAVVDTLRAEQGAK